MTLQNRVDPRGNLHAVDAKGTLMGNRGGRFHRDDQTLGRRRWAGNRWIACELAFRDRPPRHVWGSSYRRPLQQATGPVSNAAGPRQRHFSATAPLQHSTASFTPNGRHLRQT